MADDVKLWCSQEVSKFLGTDVGQEFSSYLFSIENVDDVQEYLYQLLDPNDKNVKQFVDKVCRHWKSPKQQKIPSQNAKKVEKDLLAPINSSPKTSKSEATNGLKKQSVVTKGERSPGKKKSTHFVSLYSEEGKAKSSVRLPGRHPCECLAQKHKLINNCLHCGRVVCEQEGSGPCYFCGEIVCTKEEQELLAKTSKHSQKKKEKLLDSWTTKACQDDEIKQQKATDLKNRLLEYDQTSVGRTKVIDDESDYFATDSKWLKKKERKVLREKEEKLQQLKHHRSRRDVKVTLDFAGRLITEEGVTDEINDLYQSAEEYLQSTLNNSNLPNHPNYVADPPVYIETSKQKPAGKSNNKSKSKESSRNSVRIQDKELLEMSDNGLCLSMHQPWASLLVCGIKKAEGRVWYTAHRGRLWIAATVKEATHEDIKHLENYYRALGERGPFPEHYPSGCLLGCVDVVDCLPQSEYAEKFPGGEESSSPNVFVVENPRGLLVKFPVKGQHKIWKLEKHIHQAAKKGIR